LVAAAQSRVGQKQVEAANLAKAEKTLNQVIAEEDARLARLAATRRTSNLPPLTGPVPLATTHGITVAASIVGRLDSLMNAADAAGLNLGGSGYRDSSAQIELRRQHCGTSNYAVYEMPAGACRPPTAPPGSSMHERGLAVDFTDPQWPLTSGSAAYRWLAANAGRFGFVNLPGEPWHWSTTGD
jgi:hypothetical protein